MPLVDLPMIEIDGRTVVDGDRLRREGGQVILDVLFDGDLVMTALVAIDDVDQQPESSIANIATKDAREAITGTYRWRKR
jgi:hypothetical protein